MANEFSKTQIDRLGDRLRKGDISEADLRMLDEYRRSFSEAYEFVVGAIRNELRLEPTGRPAKSTSAITEKLLRESIRLSQVQDIAGCRLVVSGIEKQNETIVSLQKLFARVTVVDRRKNPSHGYRAAHLIVRHERKLVEVQVRTSLQHLWAELSEKVADVFDPLLKYGGGDSAIAGLNLRFAAAIEEAELIELQMSLAEKILSDVSTRRGRLSKTKQDELDAFRKEFLAWRKKLNSYKKTIRDALRELIDKLENPNRG